MRTKHYIITQYWLAFYTDESDEYCTLCGNSGIIDTTGVKTPVGILIGKKNYYIYSNGQVIRKNYNENRNINKK